MPPSSSTSSSPVIIPLSSSARDSSSSSFSKSARNTGNNINSTTKRQRQTALVRTMALGAVLVALFSWEVFSGVKMTSFKAEIGMIEESLLLLNTSIFSISEKLSFQQPKDDTIAASAPPPLQINTSSSMEGRNVSSNNNNGTKPQSQQPQGGGTAEDYRLLNHRSPILDLLCSECRASMTSLRGGTLACGNLINNQIQKLNKHHNNNTESSEEEEALLLLRSAVNRVLKLAPPEECARCRFDACNTTVSSEKEYWRPDDAAPRILMAKTLQLSTIPGEHRVPPLLLSDLTTFFSNKSNVYPARTYYFEYNPSIIQIPKSQIPTSVLTTQQEVDQEVKYLASFRVTNMQQCISGNDELVMIGGQWPRPPSQDYLGLALLRSDLSVIANVVLDNKNTPATAAAGGGGGGGGGGQVPTPPSSLSSMEDYRLFVLQDQIYVASFHEIVPIWLVPPKTPTLDLNSIRVVPNLFRPT